MDFRSTFDEVAELYGERPRYPEPFFAVPHPSAMRSLCWLSDAEIKSSHHVAAT